MSHDSEKPVRDTFLIFGSPAIEQAEIDEVLDSLRSGWIGTGPKVARFESDFADYKSVAREQVAAVNSCTAALHLSLLAAGIGNGDEVITTPLTFCATLNAIIHAGATPILADVDPASMNIDPDKIENAITDRTRAILPVHFAGRPCEMDRLMAIARKHDLLVIEDCAHAVETEYRGQKAGSIGDFGCFSFYVTKNVAAGEGGMVIARNREAVDRIKNLALHGLSKDAWKRFGDSGYRHYEVVDCGFKYNMMDLQAALGIHQLARVDENHQRREAIWQRYMQAFPGSVIGLPAKPAPETKHAFHLFTVLVDRDRCGIERDMFLDKLTQRNIGAGVHYLSVAEHPYYQNRFGWQPDAWPVAMTIGRQTASLPLSPGLSDEDVEDVIIAVLQALR